MVFNYRSIEWRNLKKRVLKRDNYICRNCGQLCLGKNRNGYSPIVDHILPVKTHPKHSMSIANLQVLCRACDNAKHAEKGRGYEVEPVTDDGFPADSEWR